MDKYQNKLNFRFQTNQLVLKTVGNIDFFNGKWSIIEQKENDYLKELRTTATIESIGSSTRIEGAQLTNDEIIELLQNLDVKKLKTKDQQDIVGYQEVIEIIFKGFSDFILSKNSIQQLHQRLFKYSINDDEHRGNYKTRPNRVLSNYPDGTKRVLFNTTEPHLVEKEMTELIAWTNQQFISGLLHPLIIIGMFNYEFLSIHPFQDGNGPLSRLLTNLLLLKYNYKFIQYVSFESLIEKKKNNYFEALKDGQKDRYSYEERVDKWILFFLHTLDALIYKLEQKYEPFESKKGYINERQKKIIGFIKKMQPIKLADLTNGMPDISINTLKKDLKYLKAENIIEASGKNRGTIYTLQKI